MTSAETNRKGAGSGSSPTVNSILVPGILLENRENRVLAESKLMACSQAAKNKMDDLRNVVIYVEREGKGKREKKKREIK